MANAAPEWQAGSMWWRSSEPMEACPLEGLVRSACIPKASGSVPSNRQQNLKTHDRIFKAMIITTTKIDSTLQTELRIGYILGMRYTDHK